ncbi:predicted protein [Naegleria gruberi]|uniref:Predicted protein n=1 Tax=Naegleria gruberi TaxID=5762 RepID=D2VQZ8_NAEGR|nr:uncharacterized protein NAEGRDRAFT_71405 [Naegleria gruberi]EFC40801.1 predicted protein [Naegleria gruberi]|eukprot:XP_002673545.1 predicted protein [Naegleria gruberi strain NEG-M]
MSENVRSMKGLDLCERFYHQIVTNILYKSDFGNFNENHSAALIGYGSEVLGFDTEMSRDHDFAPRVILFLTDEYEEFSDKIKMELDEKVPSIFEGIPCRMRYQEDPNSRTSSDDNLGDLLIQITTIEDYFSNYLLKRTNNDGTSYSKWLIEILNGDYTYWLSIPQQKLLAIGQAGRIYHDCGILKPIRELIGNYYPDIVWIYQIMIQLSKISQEAPFVGRCGVVGDRLGCFVLVGKIVREMMCLCFLLERKYYPYSKWFGSAFSELESSKELKQALEMAIRPSDSILDQSENWWKIVDGNMATCYKIIIKLLNDFLVEYLRKSKKLPEEYLIPFNVDEIVCQFWGRPFTSFDHLGILNGKLRAWIEYYRNDSNQSVKNFALFVEKSQPLKGAIDQVINQVEILESSACYQDFHSFQ